MMEHPVIINSKGKIGTRDSLNRIYGNSVVVPQFEIYANPSIRISDVKSRRFNLIDRNIIQKARQDIMDQVDTTIFQTLDQIDKEKE